MDALSDVLKAVRLTGAFFYDVDASDPWVAETPPGRAIVNSIFPGSDISCAEDPSQWRRRQRS